MKTRRTRTGDPYAECLFGSSITKTAAHILELSKMKMKSRHNRSGNESVSMWYYHTGTDQLVYEYGVMVQTRMRLAIQAK